MLFKLSAALLIAVVSPTISSAQEKRRNFCMEKGAILETEVKLTHTEPAWIFFRRSSEVGVSRFEGKSSRPSKELHLSSRTTVNQKVVLSVDLFASFTNRDQSNSVRKVILSLLDSSRRVIASAENSDLELGDIFYFDPTQIVNVQIQFNSGTVFNQQYQLKKDDWGVCRFARI